ncbi:MAG: hypothetical protein GY720_05190 [bacterium]|nr:hypothetical protein [bacterium]
MQSMPRWLQMASLTLALSLTASACGGDAAEPEVTVPSTLAPTTTTTTTIAESGPGGEYGCRGSGTRTFAQSDYEQPPELTFAEALNAPELDPGRMLYIYDAVATGDDISVLNPSAAETALADDYSVLDQFRGDIVELADAAAGNDLAGTWIQDNVLMIATAGDPAVIEAALANITVPLEVVQVDYQARKLIRWAGAISELGTPADPVLVNIDEVRNVITVQISPEAPFDLAGIPCAAVELVLAGDL